MIQTLSAKWEPYEARRGVTIFRRIARTGTSGGGWATSGSIFGSLKAARSYVDSLPVGHIVRFSPREVVT
jgi:hypothetical protein